jgi:hypothetical protein
VRDYKGLCSFAKPVQQAEWSAAAAAAREPTFTTRVECLPSCCSEDNPPKYPPTTSGEYLLERYAETQAGYVKPLVAAGA